jgi:hypothetical protein
MLKFVGQGEIGKMHLHGANKKNYQRSVWPGILILAIMAVMLILAIIRVGWLAFAPLGFAGFILFVALWFMRATI